MDYIKISELNNLNNITNNDFFPLIDSQSLTTVKATFDLLSTWTKTYTTSGMAMSTNVALLTLPINYTPTSSYSLTSSLLNYNNNVNGTSSYTFFSILSKTGSYFEASHSTALFATNTISASNVTMSISSSYITASGVYGSVISTSYSQTASWARIASSYISSSINFSSSYAITSSRSRYAVNRTSGVPFNIYGPFISDSNDSSPTIEWSQYDESKRSVAFFITDTSDVIIKCLINYNTFRDADNETKIRYIGAKLIGEGLPNPITNNIVNSSFDSIVINSPRNTNTEGYVNNIAELTFRFNNLYAGQYRIYIIPCYNLQHIDPIEYAISASNSQITDYNSFLSDVLYVDSDTKIEKFPNSVYALVYSKKPVIQGLYPTIDNPNPVATQKVWKLTYVVNDNVLSHGQFEWEYSYYSSLGSGNAKWIGPMGTPGDIITLFKCLPSDHFLLSTTIGPYGQITTYPELTTVPCSLYSDPWGSNCGGWLNDQQGNLVYLPC